MTDISPEEVVRRFWTEFGPTYDDAVSSSEQWLHEDLKLTAVGHTIEDRATMIADLTRARDVLGVHGYRITPLNIAANGNVVFAQRHEELLDADGAIVTVFDVVGVFTVKEGRITHGTDYFFDSRQMSADWSGEGDQVS